MSTENSVENKARFFALYYGQDVYYRMRYPIESPDNVAIELTGTKINNIVKHGSYPYSFLSLRSISSLTGEEKETYMQLGNDNFVRYLDGMINSRMKVVQVDYLRSIGILIPWMDLSVEQIIEFGWGKIISHEG